MKNGCRNSSRRTRRVSCNESRGADGGFAILMNLLQKQYADMKKAIDAGNWDEAARINISMSKLYNMMEEELIRLGYKF